MKQTATRTQLETSQEFEQLDVLSAQAEAPESREKGIEFARRIWEARRFLAKVAAVGCLAGAGIALLIPNRYESTARLMPPDSQSGNGMALLAALAGKGSGTMGGGIGAVAGDLLGVKSTSAVYIGVLRSQTVEERLVERFNLKHVYWIKTDEDARKKLEGRSAISEDRKSGIITIDVEDGSAQRAAAIAQGYVEELNKLVVDLSTSSAHRERVFLEERLAKVKSELDQSSVDFSQFASKNKALEIKDEARAMLQGAAALEGELIAAESQLQGLRTIYTDNNVRVRSLQSRIAELRSQLNKMAGKGADEPSPKNSPGSLGSPGSQDLPGSSSSPSSPGSSASVSDSSADSMLPSMRNLPLLGVKYADLYRHMQIEEAVFETLTQQYELAKVQEAKETPSVKVLDSAKVPEKKSFPPRLLIALVSGSLALFGAVCWVVGRARWEEVEATDPRKVLASEVLHSVHSMMPWATPNGSRFQAMTNRVWTKFVKRGGSAGDKN